VLIGAVGVSRIRREVLRCSGACAVLIFIIVRHSRTKLPLWICRGAVRCSGGFVVFIFIITVRHSRTELPLWIRRGAFCFSGLCVVLISSLMCTTPAPNCHFGSAAEHYGAPVRARCSFSASLAVSGCPWLSLAAPGCPWLLLGCSWLLLAAPGLLLAAPGCSSLPLAVPGCL
jgi:hypothetical protein